MQLRYVKECVHEATGVSVRTIQRVIRQENTAPNNDEKKRVLELCRSIKLEIRIKWLSG